MQFRILLQGVKGVNPNGRDHDSKTPLMICSAVNHERLSVIFASHLLSWGADVGLPDKNGRNALCWACWKGMPGLVEALLDAYPDTCFYDLRHTDNRGNTVLHYAALGGDKLIIKMVIETFIAMNIPLNSFNHRGETPIDVAVKRGNMEGARVFVDLGQAQIVLDTTGESSSGRWLPSGMSSEFDDSKSRQTSIIISDGRHVKSSFSGKKQIYREKQRIEAEGGMTTNNKKLHMLSQVYNAFQPQFSNLYRSGAVTPPEPDQVPEEELGELGMSTAAQAVKFAHLMKQGKQDGSSRAPSVVDSHSQKGASDTASSRSQSRFGGFSRRTSSMGFNKDVQGAKGGRASSMGKGRSMSRARSRVGSSMSRSRQRPMSRQQSMGAKKQGGVDNRKGNQRSDRQRLNSAKAKLRLPMRPTKSLRYVRRGSWPADPATIRRLTPKDVDLFRSKGVNSMKRWRSEWDLDNISMLQMCIDTTTLKRKGIGRGKYSKNTPRGGSRLQKTTPRKGGKNDPFRKGFKLDLSSTSFVDISDLMPSKSPPLTTRSNLNATMTSGGGLSPTITTGRNKSPSVKKRGRNKEPVVEVVVQPVHSAGWINRRIKKLQEDIRILDAKQRAQQRKQKSILKGTSSYIDNDLQKSLCTMRIRDMSDDELAKTGTLKDGVLGIDTSRKKKKRVRIVTRQNSATSLDKSGDSSSDSEFELSDEVKTEELLRAFLEKHNFATFQDRFLPNIIRRPAAAPVPSFGRENRDMAASITLTSKPRLPHRPVTSLYPGQGQIVADAATLAKYHSNPLANVGINPSVGEKYNQKMHVTKPVPGFWRPVRPIWMG